MPQKSDYNKQEFIEGHWTLSDVTRGSVHTDEVWFVLVELLQP